MTESAEQRRRRLDAVFGEVLPTTTRDERDPGEDGTRGGDCDRDDATDTWLKAQVPPHHGG